MHFAVMQRHAGFVCFGCVCTEQSAEETDTQRGCWLTTIPSGARICTVGTTHKHIPTTSLLAFKATDPFTHEVRVLLVLHRLPGISTIVLFYLQIITINFTTIFQ